MNLIIRETVWSKIEVPEGKEEEVFQMVSKGKSSSEIQHELGVKITYTPDLFNLFNLSKANETDKTLLFSPRTSSWTRRYL